MCKELAFKTVIGLGNSGYFVRGSDSTGGVSATTEFPASWYESLSTAQGGNSCWVTWHILKSFQWKEYDPNASHNNDTDNRWIGNENEVTKPGSYDSINAAEIAAEDVTITLTFVDTWWDGGVNIYAWVWGDGISGSWVKATKSSSSASFVLPSGCSKFIIVRMNPNGGPSWDANIAHNQSGDIFYDGSTSYSIDF